MAWVFGGKKFGQYTYEHWFDDETNLEVKTQDAAQQEAVNEEPLQEASCRQNKELKNEECNDKN